MKKELNKARKEIKNRIFLAISAAFVLVIAMIETIIASQRAEK